MFPQLIQEKYHQITLSLNNSCFPPRKLRGTQRQFSENIVSIWCLSVSGPRLAFHPFSQNVYVIAWFVVIFGINTTSDISKLLYVISRAVRRVKFVTILKYHKWYLCQISRTNHAIICLYYYPQKVCNFHMWVFQIKLKYHCSKPIKLQKFVME